MIKIEFKAPKMLISKIKRTGLYRYIIDSNYVKALLVTLISIFVFYILNQSKTLTVTGTYSSNVGNQVASFSLYLSTTNKDKATAVSETNKKAEEVITQIKSFGIKDTDIKTANLNIYQKEEPVWERGVQAYKPTDWYAGISIDVTVRDLSRVNDFTMMVTSLKTDSIYGPNFTVDNSSIDETRLLQGALDDASEKARFIGIHMKRNIGKVLHVVEGGSSLYDGAYAKVSNAVGGGGSPDLQPGSSQVSKTITVTYELK